MLLERDGDTATGTADIPGNDGFTIEPCAFLPYSSGFEQQLLGDRDADPREDLYQAVRDEITEGSVALRR